MLLCAASEIQFCDHDALSSDAFAMENVFGLKRLLRCFHTYSQKQDGKHCNVVKCCYCITLTISTSQIHL